MHFLVYCERSTAKMSRDVMPGWHDLRARAEGWPPTGELVKALRGTIFVEYSVPQQGLALFVHARPGPTANVEGHICHGVHIAGSDAGYQQYMQKGETEIGAVHLFHFCSQSANCRVRREGVVHITRYRLLTRDQASTVGYAQDAVAEYLDALDEVCAAQGSADGNPKRRLPKVSVAVQEEASSAKRPAPSEASLGQGAEWMAAVGAQNVAGQIAMDSSLAQALAEADLRVAGAAPQVGSRLIGGLGGGAKPPAEKTVPFLAPPAKAPVGPPAPIVIDKRIQFDSPAPEAAPAPTAKATSTEPEVSAPDSSSAGQGATSPGALMQAQLIRVAQKRASASSLSRITPKVKHARLVNTLAALLGGGVEGAGGSDVDEECDDPSESLFRTAPSASVGPETTPVFAARKPGELMAGGVERVRSALAAVHGEEAVASEGRRLFTFYYQVLVRPRLPQNLSPHSEREMVTLVEAIDCLLEGNPARVGDILISRLKAVEEAARDGTWSLAQEYEAVPSSEPGLASESERHHAAALQLRKAKLVQHLASLNSGRRP